MNDRIISVINEKGKDQKICLITRIKLDDKNKEYLVYTLEDEDKKTKDIYISSIEKEEDDSIYINEIYDAKEKALVEDFVKSIINNE